MNGKKLRDKRKELKLTQTQLATELGVSMRTVQNWEGDINTIPKSVDFFFDKHTDFSPLNNKQDTNQSVPLKQENEDPFQDLTVDKKLDKLYYLLSTCVDKIISMEDEIKKLSNEKEQDKEKSIAKTKSKIEREILKAESVKVDLKHGDTKP